MSRNKVDTISGSKKRISGKGLGKKGLPKNSFKSTDTISGSGKKTSGKGLGKAGTMNKFVGG